jgi:hypothetical protein
MQCSKQPLVDHLAALAISENGNLDAKFPTLGCPSRPAPTFVIMALLTDVLGGGPGYAVLDRAGCLSAERILLAVCEPTLAVRPIKPCHFPRRARK